jgi:hypothetical protein
MYEVLQALAHKAGALVNLRPGSWSPGKVASIWTKYQAEVEAVVRAQKLQPVQILAEAVAAEKQLAAGAGDNILVWWNLAGGWPLAHFHLGDKIYPATPAQWNTFSSQVVAKVGASLQASKAKVSFDQLTQITEGAAQL